MKTLLAIDQGTTSSRAILFSERGEIIDIAQKELTLHYPNNGWVEQDARDIWNDTQQCCEDILSRAKNPPMAIGITNQRETTVIWDRKTGEPIYNAIVWQDRRTSALCEKLREQNHEETITAKTGLLLDPYFSATKIAWILDNVKGARTKAENGELAFGTIDCFLLWKLTNGERHATDITNASRTMLYNIVEQKWDEELLALFNIPKNLLPEVCDNIADYGAAFDNIPIGGMAGDQHAALIGQGCVHEGMIKSTYGTGCFALMNIGEQFKPSQNRLLTTVAYRINGETSYAIEGSIFVAGAAMQWLRDGLELYDDTAQSEDMANSVDDNNGVYFVPAFTGLGAPHWKPEARAIITGLTRDTTKAHIVRAALEAQAYQTLDLIDAMEADSGHKAKILRADGGLVANAFMCQFLSDMLERPVEIPAITESTAWGAAILAGVSVGVFPTIKTAAQSWTADKTYKPNMNNKTRTELYTNWHQAINMLLH